MSHRSVTLTVVDIYPKYSATLPGIVSETQFAYVDLKYSLGISGHAL